MKIEKIILTNALSFKKRTVIELNEDLNIFIGPNGGGKTNLSNIISILFKGLIPSYSYRKDAKGLSLEPNMNFRNVPEHIKKHYENNSESEFELTLKCNEVDIVEINKIISRKSDIIIFIHEHLNETIPPNIDKWKTLELQSFSHTKKITGSQTESLDHTTPEFTFIEYLKFFELIKIVENKIGKTTARPPILLFPSGRAATNFSQTVVFSREEDVESVTKAFSLQSITGLNTSHYQQAMIQLASEFLECLYDLPQNELGALANFKCRDSWKSLEKCLSILSIKPEWIVENKNTNAFKLQLLRNEVDISSGNLSSGEMQFIHFMISLSCIGCKDGLVIIDEPELNLHIQKQKELLAYLQEVQKANNFQLIIITHSSAFVNPHTVNKLFRVFKNGNSSEVRKITGTGSTSETKTLQMITATNNEKVFFSDFVIFVEGLSDKIIFESLLKHLPTPDLKNLAIEFIDMRGSTWTKEYLSLIQQFHQKGIAIVDLDYLHTNPDAKHLFSVNEPDATRELVAEKSRDVKKIYALLRSSIQKNAISTDLISTFEHLCARFKKINLPLSASNEQLIVRLIFENNNEGIHVLKRGAVEDYLPADCTGKNQMDELIKYFSESSNVTAEKQEKIMEEWQKICVLAHRIITTQRSSG